MFHILILKSILVHNNCCIGPLKLLMSFSVTIKIYQPHFAVLLGTKCIAMLTIVKDLYIFQGEAIATISKDCHHELWTATNFLTDSSYLRSLVIPMCSSDWKIEWDHDNLLMKLLDNVNNMKSPQCRLLVQRIGLVAFSDFRIIAHFTNICENDIQRFQCGRIGLDKMVSLLHVPTYL